MRNRKPSHAARRQSHSQYKFGWVDWIYLILLIGLLDLAVYILAKG